MAVASIFVAVQVPLNGNDPTWMESTPLLAVPIIDPDPDVPNTEVRSTGSGSEQLTPRATDVPVPVKVEPDWTMSVVRSNEYVQVIALAGEHLGLRSNRGS